VIAVDTGFFYALADADDAWHARALAWQPSIAEGWITTWPVLAEATHLLGGRLGPAVAADLLQDVADGAILVWELTPAACGAIPALIRRYARLPMDLADASLVLLAEHLGHGRILSTDERDFGACRWKSRKPFQNLLLLPPGPA
jgi:uncharacterized protein